MIKKLMILVCTEGKETEKAFLKQVMKAFRVSADIVKFRVKQGAHQTLIDNCVKQRADISIAKKIPENSIEVWAMCDRDGFKGKYSDLAKYAEANNVKLAFSSPQFESFII